jgi:cell wall-associated NlpC family hydrolase
MVYGRMGIRLPRDAREQILTGQEIETPALGDLIFWGKSKQDIRHVGICLGGAQFIHTSARENKPYLRMSFLTDVEWNGDSFYPYRASIQKKSMAAAVLAPMSMKIR